MTLLEVLTAASGYLEKQGIESPRLNTEHLLAHLLGKKRIELYMEFDRPLGEEIRAPLRELVRKRSEGVPLQHLLGTVDFCGHLFACDSRALIPRPETEQLVELVQSKIQNPKSKILDIGTGSGIIALTLALEFPEAAVTATDLSQDALALARENALRHDLERVTFICCDLFPPGEDRYEVIVANLPYIPAGEIPNLSREVQFDPASALDGGPDGLDIIRRLISLAPQRLLPGGRIFLEIGHDQSSAVNEMLTAHNYRDIASHRDYQGVQRFHLATYG